QGAVSAAPRPGPAHQFPQGEEDGFLPFGRTGPLAGDALPHVAVRREALADEEVEALLAGPFPGAGDRQHDGKVLLEIGDVRPDERPRGGQLYAPEVSEPEADENRPQRLIQRRHLAAGLVVEVEGWRVAEQAVEVVVDADEFLDNGATGAGLAVGRSR